MSSDNKTMDGGEKQEEGDPSEVDEKAEDVSEVEADKLEENEGENEEIGEPEDQAKEELEEGNVEDEDAEAEGKETDEKIIVKKGSKKHKEIESGELKPLRTPTSERPTRERKTVERFKVGDTPRSSASKTLAIEKGRGTQLKDIPNVAFKLSKRKADENLQLLHSILFGKKAKVHTLKKNIGLFSGFIWAENEEKQKVKVKEKIEKCVKEKLLDFCDILNISINKASVKKEELVAKLVEFLESPRVTTNSLLADKEKGKKRKSKSSTSKSSSSSLVIARKSAKKQKLDFEPGKKRKSSIEEDDNKSQLPNSDDDDDDNTAPEAESEHEEDDLEDKTDEDEPKEQKSIEKVSSKKSTGNNGVKSKSANKRSPAKALKPAGKSIQKSTSPVLKKGAEAESKGKVKAPLTKKKKVVKESEKDTKGTSSSKKNSKSSAPAKASELDEGVNSQGAELEKMKYRVVGAEISHISRFMVNWKDHLKEKEEIEKEEEDEVLFLEPKPNPKPPFKKCKICRDIHSPVENCRGRKCNVCYSNEHLYCNCPYINDYPRDAEYNRAQYEIHCSSCGCLTFDTANWVCPSAFCGDDAPALRPKKCKICNSVKEHNTFECPNDKEAAANYKIEYDNHCLRWD